MATGCLDYFQSPDAFLAVFYFEATLCHRITSANNTWAKLCLEISVSFDSKASECLEISGRREGSFETKHAIGMRSCAGFERGSVIPALIHEAVAAIDGHGGAFGDESGTGRGAEAVAEGFAVERAGVALEPRLGHVVNGPARMLHAVFESRAVGLAVVAPVMFRDELGLGAFA